ncbi:hypothetical protein [Actinomadura mexicana]|uniref:Uncharacterized protein n=1 Tax=Actinomadura mexicana TaxID=134959 RepID=A0A239CIK4_9ACTN|nr:hypothetical protein [Actinomadura mexicana]SNS20015.1 hypothetical protein SAMN06265355_112235 [Actinomadura mexicana]
MTEPLLWRWLGTLAPVLIGLCVLGFWGMSALQASADRARELDCLHDRAAAHWSHGYGAWLPIGVLTAAVLALVLAVAVLAVGARSPLWARLLCYPTALIAVVALLLAAITTHDHFTFPGGDISTVNSAPCGVG